MLIKMKKKVRGREGKKGDNDIALGRKESM
jgi:hypothetical protein